MRIATGSARHTTWVVAAVPVLTSLSLLLAGFGPARSAEICFHGVTGPEFLELTTRSYTTDGSVTCPLWDCSAALSRGLVSVSLSSEDMYANTGPLPGDGKLYLWFECGPGAENITHGCLEPVSWINSLDIVSYDPTVGDGEYLGGLVCFRNLAGLTDGTLLGVLTVSEPVGVDPISWGRIRSFYR